MPCTATTSGPRAASPSTPSPPRKPWPPSPPGLTFTQASALPQLAAIASQGTEGLEAGQRLLINGGGGGSGSLAIQLATRAGAHVTAVDNATKLDHMLALGADEVIDYHTTDFTSRAVAGATEPYDRILDLVAQRSVLGYRRALAPGGRYLCVGGSVPTLLRVLIGGWVVGRLSGRHIGVLGVDQGPEAFGPVAERCAAGEITMPIDQTFPLSETAEALTQVGQGRSRGKVVVVIDPEAAD